MLVQYRLGQAVKRFSSVIAFGKDQAVQTIQVAERTGKDGILHLRIPVGQPEADYEAVVVLQPQETPSGPAASERGWPAGYFEQVPGSITDETFVRPPQGEYETRLELP